MRPAIIPCWPGHGRHRTDHTVARTRVADNARSAGPAAGSSRRAVTRSGSGSPVSESIRRVMGGCCVLVAPRSAATTRRTSLTSGTEAGGPSVVAAGSTVPDMVRINAVLLDAGGVFTLPAAHVVVPALRSVGVDATRFDVERAHYEAVAAYDRSEGGRGERPYLAALARALGTDGDRITKAAAALERAIEAHHGLWSSVRAESLSGLRAIADTGVAIALVSNAEGKVEEELRHHGICQVGPGPRVPVGCVIDSTVVGVKKPDPHIFEIALRRLAVPPEAALHVGDSLHADVEGAQAAGIHALHFDPYELCRGGDHEDIASLRDAARWLTSRL